MKLLVATAMCLFASCMTAEECHKRKTDEAWASQRVVKRMQQICDEFCGVMENRLALPDATHKYICTCDDGRQKEL